MAINVLFSDKINIMAFCFFPGRQIVKFKRFSTNGKIGKRSVLNACSEDIAVSVRIRPFIHFGARMAINSHCCWQRLQHILQKLHVYLMVRITTTNRNCIAFTGNWLVCQRVTQYVGWFFSFWLLAYLLRRFRIILDTLLVLTYIFFCRYLF